MLPKLKLILWQQLCQDLFADNPHVLYKNYMRFTVWLVIQQKNLVEDINKLY